MEDREACTTEIFLSNDGSVTLIGTNGPPPIATYGTWSCKGNDTFEMTIVRTYGTGSEGTDVGEFNFDVQRTFEGDISTVGNLLSVTGSMHMKVSECRKGRLKPFHFSFGFCDLMRMI